MTLKTYVDGSSILSLGVSGKWTLSAAPITGQDKLSVELTIIPTQIGKRREIHRFDGDCRWMEDLTSDVVTDFITRKPRFDWSGSASEIV